ncbi:hypothetical protein [Kutzneria sp. NPDC051319]|uniref:hypothetical protein n=1 Tax=Kutzneria sp. NPDC051319 TaxID=3155047 RepID=UPI0034199848
MSSSDDEKVRALLARAGDQAGPPLGFTPTTIARRGRRIRMLRWGSGVAGVVVVFAGVTVSLLLVSGGRPVEPASPPPPATTIATTTVDDTTPTVTTTDHGPTTTESGTTTGTTITSHGVPTQH